MDREDILKSLGENLRIDGRKLLETRKIEVEYGISKNAEGSARVKFGGTEVLAGVKLAMGTPYPDRPDEGSMMVEAELSPMSNPEFEAGPPDIQAVELARVVDRGIRESKAIDVKKLCIKEGEKCWMVCIDIVAINDEGNLIDASSLAALAALKNAVFPKIDGENVDYKSKTTKKIPLTNEPISVTVCKIGGNFIVDTLTAEEKIIDARLTIASTDKKLCSLQKGGNVPISIEDIEKMVDIGMKTADEIRKVLE
jgi:exosome complex component RRP42